MKKNINDEKVIQSIRALGLDMIDNASSGHPGIVLGAAPIIYTLFAKHLNIKPEDDKWANRDRFVLSAGHGSALLYATLYMAGYNVSIDDLKRFRSVQGITPGHPEKGITPGVEVTTGPLGQGIAMAVGMALAERYLRSILKREKQKQKVIDHYTYVLCGDGDLMEGINYEATSFAATQHLDKLIVLYDSNDVSLDGPTSKAFTESVRARFEAMGWHTELVRDGNDINLIDKAIKKAKETREKPSLIEVKTIIGYGSKLAGTSATHGNPLDKEDYLKVKATFGINSAPFEVSKDAIIYFRDELRKRVTPYYEYWLREYDSLYSSANEYTTAILKLFKDNQVDIEFNPDNFSLADNYVDDMRASNARVMNIIGDSSLFFLGGSADIASSAQTNQKKSEDLSSINPTGKNICFGVREGAMAAILNGMATYGLRVYGSSFLVFSDYMKPALRMSALMNLPVVYIFTHESVRGGNTFDGATHLPIEQIGSLRAIPNLTLYRPADINEIIGCWDVILSSSGPSALLIGKNKQEKLTVTNSREVAKGAYIVRREVNKLDATLIATGCELAIALKISEDLYNSDKSFDIRVVSMPSIELFNASGINYQNSIIPTNGKVITLEGSNDAIWYKYASDEDFVLKLDDFAYSGNTEDVLKKMDFDFNSLKEKIETILNN